MNSRSLASHRYKFHNIRDRNETKNDVTQIQPISKEVYSRKDIDQIRKGTCSAFTMVKDDIEELQENVSANKEALKQFGKQFKEVIKAINMLQRQVYEVQSETE